MLIYVRSEKIDSKSDHENRFSLKIDFARIDSKNRIQIFKQFFKT